MFYPAVRDAINKKDLVDEAIIEHRGAKTLINEIGTISAEDTLFDNKLTILKEQILQHVTEEEGEMFSKVRQTEMDLDKLGKRIAEKKAQLCRQHNMPVSS